MDLNTLRKGNRPYQNEAIDVAVNDYQKDGDGGVVILPTGSGKSRINVVFSRTAINIREGKRVLCIGGINEDLVWQMADNYEKYWPDLAGKIALEDGTLRKGVGVVMNRHNAADAAIVCASIQTLISGAGLSDLGPNDPELDIITGDDIDITPDGGVKLSKNSKRQWLVSPRMDAILEHGLIDYMPHDECHHAPADGSLLIYKRMEQLYQAIGARPIFKIGFTATLMRADGRAAANIYSKILYQKSYDYMVRHGYAAPIVEPERVIIPMIEDQHGNTARDADGYSLKSVKNWAELICEAWKEKAAGRKTLMYVGQHNGNSHLEDLEHFYNVANKNGIVCAYVDGQFCLTPEGERMPKSYRSTLYGQLNDPQHPLDMIANYEVITEGNDIPFVSCIGIARSMNETTATQSIGRGTRPAPGKQDLKILVFTDDDLVLSTTASLSGQTIDPTLEEFVPDIDVEAARDKLRQNVTENFETLKTWSNIQQIFSKDTLDKAVERLLDPEIEADDISKSEVRILKMIVGIYEDEDKLLNQINLLDMNTREGLARGKDKQYKLIDIARSSSNVWSLDDQTGMMICGVGEGLALLIHPPQDAKASIVREILSIMRRTEGTDEGLIHKYRLVQEFCANYTAFYVSTDNVFNPRVIGEKGGWFASERYIDVIEQQALEYARLQPGYVSTLSEKSKSWRYRPASDGQLRLIASLLGLKGEDKVNQLPDEYRWYTNRKKQKAVIRMGEASKIITKLSAPRAIESLRKRVDVRINEAKYLIDAESITVQSV